MNFKFENVLFLVTNNGVAKGAQRASPPILQTKHKHTFKLHKICQFGQFIFGKIIKIVATRSHLLKLKCTKFDFGWRSAPDRTGGAHSVSPDPLAGF